MKRIAAFVCLLALVTAMVSPASAIVDVGDPKVTRIWRSTDEGDRFACSATWIRPAKGYVSWLLTAGHCAGAQYVKRSVNETISGVINWRVVVTSHSYADRLIDIAIGTAPDSRVERVYHSFFADKAPTEEGTVLYIPGFPAGVESVVMARVLGPTHLGLAVQVEPGSILPGSSGSVVLDQQGFIVGVVWGLNPNDHSMVFVTPIEAFHEIVKMIGAQFNMSDDAE